MENTSENSNPTSIDPELHELYEAFKPTLIAARRSYARKRIAALLMMPLMLGVAVSVLRDNPGAQADVALRGTGLLYQLL